MTDKIVCEKCHEVLWSNPAPTYRKLFCYRCGASPVKVLASFGDDIAALRLQQESVVIRVASKDAALQYELDDWRDLIDESSERERSKLEIKIDSLERDRDWAAEALDHSTWGSGLGFLWMLWPVYLSCAIAVGVLTVWAYFAEITLSQATSDRHAWMFAMFFVFAFHTFWERGATDVRDWWASRIVYVLLQRTGWANIDRIIKVLLTVHVSLFWVSLLMLILGPAARVI